MEGDKSSSSGSPKPFDEKTEWAEIAGIMASFGGSMSRESVVVREIESKFAREFNLDSSQRLQIFGSLEDWLCNIGLPQYENLLLIHGFDDINFIGGKVIEDADLAEIGIRNAAHRKQLCEAARILPSIQPISEKRGTSFPKNVNSWLASINLSEYCETFTNNKICDMDRASKLWEVELYSVLKIMKLGHRKRILASLGTRQDDDNISKDIDFSNLTLDLSVLGIDEAPAKTPLKKDSDILVDTNANDDSSPNQSKWCHNADEIINGQCSYEVKYLGSTLVKELKGLESTRSAIQKLKKSSKDINKLPKIILSISCTGVKFINAENKKLVSEHEIPNIHGACQDEEDYRFFAYITKEHQTHHHYCHVFSCDTIDLASEVILTLGQAFEVAYQMALSERAKKALDESQKVLAAAINT